MASFTYDPNDSDQKALVDRVRVKLDEVTATGQTIGTNGDRIYEQLVEAMRTVLALASARPTLRPRLYQLATDASSSSASPVTSSDEGDFLRIEAPQDFIDFVRLKLSSWEMAVANTSDRFISDDTVQYETIQISYAAPDAYNPVVAMVSDPSFDPGIVFECYPTDSTNNPIEVFSYVGDTAPEAVPYLLEEILLYEAAANVLQNYRDEMDAANMAYNKARQILSERATSLQQQTPMQRRSEE